MTTITNNPLGLYGQSVMVAPAVTSRPETVAADMAIAAPTIGLKNSAVVSISASAQAAAAAASSVTLSTDDVVTQLADLTKQVKAGTLKTINVVKPGSQTSGDAVISLTSKLLASGADVWKVLKGDFSIAITDSKAADALASATTADKILATAKSTITKSHIQIIDTAANVVANIASLEKLAVKGEITSITISDGKALSLKAADITKNADVFNVTFGGTAKTAIEATDVLAANIAGLESGLEDNTKLTLSKVSVTDKTVNLQAAISSLETAVVAGNAANSVTPKISQITVSDKGTLTLSNTSMTADLDALKLLSGPYTLKVTDISVADALKLKAPSKEATLSLAVKDTTTSVSANWDGLQKLAAAKTLSAITLSDVNSASLSISVKQLGSSADALKVVGGSYKLAVTDALAADVATALKAKNLYSIAIKDTAANILAGMKVIGPAVTASKIASVTLTDKKAPTLSIADAFTLTKTLPNFTMPSGMKLGIADSASNVIAHKRFDVGDILANAGAISITDTTTPNLTLADATTLKSITLLSAKTKYAVVDGANTIVTQSKIAGEKILSAAAAVQINKIFSIADYKAASALKTWDKTTIYSIADTVDNVLALATNKADKILKGAKTVSIVDTAAHILAKLDNLQTIAKTGQIADITGSDALVNVTAVTDSKKISDAEAIGKILNTGVSNNPAPVAPPVVTPPVAPPVLGPAVTRLTAVDVGALSSRYSNDIGGSVISSSDGSKIVYTEVDTNGNLTAHLWNNGVTSVIGTSNEGDTISPDGTQLITYKNANGHNPSSFPPQGATQIVTTAGTVSIGNLGGGYNRAHAISTDGSTIVGEAFASGTSMLQAFIYQNGTISNLGTIHNDRWNYAFATSGGGSVVVGVSSVPVVGGANNAVIWKNGTMTDLPTLGGNQSEAFGISDDGNIIVGHAKSANSNIYNAVIWTNNTIADLGNVNGSNTTLTMISKDSSVIAGYDWDANGNSNAVIYYNNKLSELGHVSGFDNTKTIGILSDNKTIMGIAWNADGSSKVVKWVIS